MRVRRARIARVTTSPRTDSLFTRGAVGLDITTTQRSFEVDPVVAPDLFEKPAA